MAARLNLARPLAMLLLLAVLVAQLIAFAPGHSDDEARHCCPVCHASHAPVLTAASIIHFGLPVVRTYWRVTAEALPLLLEAPGSGTCSRGPPLT